MGKKSTDREEILGYIDEGWHFRVKMSKGRRYITRRRGQVERGMGPYDEGFWNMINQLVQKAADAGKPQTQERDVLETEAGEKPEDAPEWVRYEEYFSELKRQLSLYRGVEMMTSCRHRDEERFCTYWNWNDKPDFYELLEKIHFDDFCQKRKLPLNDQESERWVFKAIHWYCWGCSAYRPL